MTTPTLSFEDQLRDALTAVPTPAPLVLDDVLRRANALRRRRRIRQTAAGAVAAVGLAVGGPLLTNALLPGSIDTPHSAASGASSTVAGLTPVVTSTPGSAAVTGRVTAYRLSKLGPAGVISSYEGQSSAGPSGSDTSAALTLDPGNGAFTLQVTVQPQFQIGNADGSREDLGLFYTCANRAKPGSSISGCVASTLPDGTLLMRYAQAGSGTTYAWVDALRPDGTRVLAGATSPLGTHTPGATSDELLAIVTAPVWDVAAPVDSAEAAGAAALTPYTEIGG
jgi:hypothetical protein